MTLIARLRLLPRRHAIPACTALVLALIQFSNPLWLLPTLVAFLGWIILALYWSISLISHLVRRMNGQPRAEETEGGFFRWCVEPGALAFLALLLYLGNDNSPPLWPIFLGGIGLLVACIIRVLIRLLRSSPLSPTVPMELRAFCILVVCSFTCSLFILRFALSYPALAKYVHDAAANAPFHLTPEQVIAWNRAHPEEAYPPPLSPTTQWFVEEHPSGKAGLFTVEETLVSRSGDVLLITFIGSEFLSNDVGIYYAPDHQFLEYYDVVGIDGSFEVGELSHYTHIFGPWYFWHEG